MTDTHVRPGPSLAPSPGSDLPLGGPDGPILVPVATLTLQDLIDQRASEYGDRPYVGSARTGRSVSFAELRQVTRGLGAWFNAHEVGRGERIGIAIADPVDFAIVYLGTIASGRWAVPFDPKSPAEGLVACVQRLHPILVVSDRPVPREAPVHWIEIEQLKAAVANRTTQATTTHAGVGAEHKETGSASTPDGGAVLLSSGSSGAPKVIALRQGQLLHTARCVAEHHRLSPSDTGFNPLPLFHINAQVVGVLASLWSGARLVLDDRFHRTGFWSLIEDHRVTWVNAVPAIIAHLESPDDGERIPSRVRFIRSASAPLPTATLHRFELATGVPVIETYGMTESASQITATPLEGPRKPGSVGLPVGIDLRITDEETGLAVAGSAVGQVEIRGAAVDTPDERSFDHGPNGKAERTRSWLQTGDYGFRDEDGYLFLVGRRDDVINRGGEKVFPREIEEALHTEPSVEAVVVVAEPHSSLGQVPVAYLTVVGVAGPDQRSLAASVAGRARSRAERCLPKSRHPVRIHVVDRLPTTATGKLSRRALSAAGAAGPGSTEMSTIVTVEGR